ncbi:hypothetical protein LMG27952_02965 [Paraburkholderia hiiakae]|uniref:Uncharacterized protein n=1 Tax=Paraburkholderia hiiakae TaxID=1081782 RepID=A0ABM8NN85_9BURK|nr:hypothetical protein [Paraburkholderia hiiakae]CAD6534489.1 hypothetical protein LMG27952_02965 [Paraburkholderia hiiakae]
MITEKSRNILFCVGVASVTFALLIEWEDSTYSEPPFIVIGRKDVLSKTHVNVFMSRYESNSSMRTIYLNGDSYPSNNQNVDRFEFYINYDNKLFSRYGYDNVPRMVNDASIARNTLLICKIGSDVFFSNRFTKCEEPKDENQLRPLDEQLNADLIDEKESGKIKTKSDEQSFIYKMKSAFFEVTKSTDQSLGLYSIRKLTIKYKKINAPLHYGEKWFQEFLNQKKRNFNFSRPYLLRSHSIYSIRS